MRAILIDLIPPRMRPEQSRERLRELEELVKTYGGIVVVKSYQRRSAPHPRTFIGTGKAAELAEEGKALGATLLLVNDRLKPGQIFHLSDALQPAKIEVWDRIDLILKIFAKHAATTEARLEIELASVRHMGPRIFGMGMELSRQAGGIGTIGIGETNTEIMKRHLREKERKILERLEQYQKVREGHRKNRRRNALSTVSLVGYTNAGKTSLLNALTGRREYVADKLFATLDTRVGELYVPTTGKSILISDTIGFIRQLPPELLHAFRSTLSEVMASDLLLHVVDISDPLAASKIRTVRQILDELGVGGKPCLYVFNKCDSWKKPKDFDGWLVRLAIEPGVASFVSASTGEGLDLLTERIGVELSRGKPDVKPDESADLELKDIDVQGSL